MDNDAPFSTEIETFPAWCCRLIVTVFPVPFNMDKPAAGFSKMLINNDLILIRELDQN